MTNPADYPFWCACHDARCCRPQCHCPRTCACRGRRTQEHTALTEDDIHNWGEPSVQRLTAHLPAEVQEAARAAMVRHHQQGSNAKTEAEAINNQCGLRG